MVARKTRTITRKQKKASFHQTSLRPTLTRASIILAKASTTPARESTGQHTGAIKAENTKVISVEAEELTTRGSIGARPISPRSIRGRVATRETKATKEVSRDPKSPVVKRGLVVAPRKVASMPSEEEATEDTSPKAPVGTEGSVLGAVNDEKTNDCRNVMYVTSLRRGAIARD
jgi:hypothetical protein